MDPVIDFKAEDAPKALPEGLTPELLNNPIVQGYIKIGMDSNYTNRFEVESSGLKKNNEKLLAEKGTMKEAMVALEESIKGVNVDEFNRLKELAKNNGDATKQLEVITAERDGIKASFEGEMSKKDLAYAELQGNYYGEQLSNQVTGGIAEYNAKNTALKLNAGNERWVQDEAKKTWRRDDTSGEWLAYDGDTVLTGQDGKVLGYPEWVGSLRERAGFKDMYSSPKGGGAGGGGPGETNKNYNPKDMGGTEEQRQAALRAKHPDLQ